MATVRALQPCWMERQYREPGKPNAEFEYHGPEQHFLQLVSGSWEDKPKPAKPISSEEALQLENDMLRKQLAELQAQGKPVKVPAKNLGKIPTIKVEPAAPPVSESESAEEPFDALAAANAPVDVEPPKKGKKTKKTKLDPAAV